MKKKPVYKALTIDMNTNKPEFINIFGQYWIDNYLEEIVLTRPSREEIKERFNILCKSEFKGRIEYEIDVKMHLFDTPVYCINVYEQIEVNLDMLVDMIVEYIK